jgi:hypothetical protein
MASNGQSLGSGQCQCLADVGRQVLIGREELVPQRVDVAALTPGEVDGEIFDVDLYPGPVGGAALGAARRPLSALGSQELPHRRGCNDE